MTKQLAGEAEFLTGEDIFFSSASDQAFSHIISAEEKGYPPAYLLLCQMYSLGKGGVTQSEQKAAYYEEMVKSNIHWFEDQASQNPNGQYFLAVCYAQGIGVSKNFEKAFFLFQSAATQNQATAAFYLGMWYEWGHFVNQNHQMAVKYYFNSAQNGNKSAQDKIKTIFEEIKKMGASSEPSSTSSSFSSSSDSHSSTEYKPLKPISEIKPRSPEGNWVIRQTKRIYVGANRQLVAAKTEGKGDCPFHAAFGEWNELLNMYICKDVTERRKKLKEAIIEMAESKESSDLRDSCVEALQEFIMSDRECGEATHELLLAYRGFRDKYYQESSQNWAQFEAELRKFDDIVNHINTKGQGNSFRNRFQYLRKQDEFLNYIRTVPSLRVALESYDMLEKAEFGWEPYLAKSLKEYANFVGQSGQPLNYPELKIIALVFNISIIYYAHHNANPEILNKNQKSFVKMQFNGINHYERLVDIPQITNHKGCRLILLPPNTEVKKMTGNRIVLEKNEDQVTALYVDTDGVIKKCKLNEKIIKKLPPFPSQDEEFKILMPHTHEDLIIEITKQCELPLHKDNDKGYLICIGGQNLLRHKHSGEFHLISSALEEEVFPFCDITKYHSARSFLKRVIHLLKKKYDISSQQSYHFSLGCGFYYRKNLRTSIDLSIAGYQSATDKIQEAKNGYLNSKGDIQGELVVKTGLMQDPVTSSIADEIRETVLELDVASLIPERGYVEWAYEKYNTYRILKPLLQNLDPGQLAATILTFTAEPLSKKLAEITHCPQIERATHFVINDIVPCYINPYTYLPRKALEFGLEKMSENFRNSKYTADGTFGGALIKIGVRESAFQGGNYAGEISRQALDQARISLMSDTKVTPTRPMESQLNIVRKRKRAFPFH